MLAILGVLTFFLYRSQAKKEEEATGVLKEELDMQMYGIEKENISEDNVIPLKLSGSDKNVETYQYKNTKEIYNVKNSKKVKESLTNLKKKNKYSVDNCLWAYNPYGTHDLSLYLYFQTSEVVTLRYTIHVEDEDIPDFTRTARVDDSMKGTKEVECIISGLVPDMKNYIVLKLMNDSGTVVKRVVYSITPGKAPNGIQKQIMVKDGNSLTSISNGLYVFLGHDADNKKMKRGMYLYDNSGVLRGIIPTVSGRTTGYIMIDNAMFYNFSEDGFASVSPTGQVMKVYHLDGFKTVNDFTYDGYGDIITVASKKKGNTIEDQIVSINLESGKTKHLVNMGSVLEKVKKKAKNKRDWIGLNSISWIGKDSVVVSSRELSGILKVRNVSSVVPKVEYIIGDAELWKKQGRTKGLLSKYVSEDTQEDALAQEPFMSQYGQSSVAVSSVEEQYPSNDSQYYLTMFNNNYNKQKASTSYYYKFYIDELTGTYDLAKSFELPYSTYESSVQEYAGNIIANSATHCMVGEYDAEGGLIQQLIYNADTYTYRVWKENFKNFWFS